MVKGWFLFDLLWCWLSKGETGARQQTQYGSDLDLTSLYRFYSSSSPSSSPSSSSPSPSSFHCHQISIFQEVISFIPNTSPDTNMIMGFLSFSHRDSINCGEIWSCLRPLSTSTQNPEALHRLWRNKKPFWSSPSSKVWVGGLVTMQVIGITCVCGRYCPSNCDTQSVKRISHLP